tara:strand:+ start:8246 stop:9130 length:885 start_codon:yes stop_codon:yes gene_type:complete
LGKNKLFKIGVTALQSISDFKENLYVCPICLNGFNIESISKKELTLEHAPQRSIGGKEILLTCVKCNNEAGHTIDAELDKREKSFAFLKAISKEQSFSGRMKLNQGGVATNVNVDAVNGHIHLEIPKKINHPTGHKKIFNHLDYLATNKALWSNEKIKLTTVYPYHKHKARVGDLKSAYLLAFATLGYRYILQDSLNIVREQILNPDQKLVTGIYLGLNHTFPEERKLIELESPIKAIIVQIDRRLIFLPPIKSDEVFFEVIISLLSNNKNGQLNGVELGWPETMEMRLDYFHS